MLQRPATAPPDWSQEHTQAAVRDVVLRHSPDFVMLQELPGVVPYVETHDMIRANPISHSGNLATLIGHHLLDDEPGDQEPVATVVPGCGLLTTLIPLDLTIANVHLNPGPGPDAARERLAQLEAVVTASPTTDLVIIGDTNTRTDEERDIAALRLTGTRPPEPTWNSKRNPFRSDGHEFVAFFSRYFATDAVVVTDLAVLSDEPVTAAGHTFHLSDHYAFTGSISRRD